MNNSQATPTGIQTSPEPAPESTSFPEPDPEVPESTPETTYDEPDPEVLGSKPEQTSQDLPPELDPEVLDQSLL